MKKTLLTLFVAAITFTSCSDYLDINESTNNPHTEDIDPTALLASALSTPFRTQSTTMNELGSVMTNAWGSNVNAWTGGYATEYTLNFTTSTRSTMWDNLYLGMNNLNNIIKFPNPTHAYDNYVAIAKLTKAHYMGYIIDLYGDAPYSQAFKGTESLRPTYDDDKEIYKDLLLQIDEARALITANKGEPVNAQDIVFKGVMSDWTALANTLELRLLLRLTGVTDAELVTLRNTRIAALSGKPFLTKDAKLNPGYVVGASAQANPFYATWGPGIDGSTSGTRRTFTTASGYIAGVLNGTTTNAHIDAAGVVDPRRIRMFLLRTGKVAGVAQGDVTVAAGGTAPNPVSYLGAGVTGIAGTGAAVQYENGSTKDSYFLLGSESLFLQSEAAFRYPAIFAGDAKALFQAGIKSSFDHYDQPLKTITLTPAIAPSAQAYIDASNVKLGLGWDATPNKIEAIMTQKWLALQSINGIESYIDMTRTGFPVVPLASTAIFPRKPLRMLYPQSEYTANSANVPKVTLDQIFVKNEFTPFWNK